MEKYLTFPVTGLTVDELITQLNWAKDKNFINGSTVICVGGGGNETCVVENLALPKVVLDLKKEIKSVSMIFTEL